jgi:copper chaperone CopZ
MRLLIDSTFDKGLDEYLLSQDGINEVEIKNIDFLTELTIKIDNSINEDIVLKFINLFDDNKIPSLVEFDKDVTYQIKELKYTIKDMCCEYCYKGLVEELYEQKYIKSVKSNFDFNVSAYDIEFIIEYDSKYNEEEIIKLLK